VDNRVPFWHPLSYVSKLRRTATNNPALFLEISEGTTGHFGRSGETGKFTDISIELAFLLSSVPEVKR
jgi:protease II